MTYNVHTSEDQPSELCALYNIPSYTPCNYFLLVIMQRDVFASFDETEATLVMFLWLHVFATISAC